MSFIKIIFIVTIKIPHVLILSNHPARFGDLIPFYIIMDMISCHVRRKGQFVDSEKVSTRGIEEHGTSVEILFAAD